MILELVASLVLQQNPSVSVIDPIYTQLSYPNVTNPVTNTIQPGLINQNPFNQTISNGYGNLGVVINTSNDYVSIDTIQIQQGNSSFPFNQMTGIGVGSYLITFNSPIPDGKVLSFEFSDSLGALPDIFAVDVWNNGSIDYTSNVPDLQFIRELKVTGTTIPVRVYYNYAYTGDIVQVNRLGIRMVYDTPTINNLFGSNYTDLLHWYRLDEFTTRFYTTWFSNEVVMVIGSNLLANPIQIGSPAYPGNNLLVQPNAFVSFSILGPQNSGLNIPNSVLQLLDPFYIQGFYLGINCPIAGNVLEVR